MQYSGRKWLLMGLLVIAVTVQAADVAWDGGGTNDRWLTPENWVLDVLPGPADRVYLDEPNGLILIEAGDTVACNKIIGPCRSTQAVTTMTITGGSLTNPSYWYVGQVPGGEGVVNISGGTVTTRDFILGRFGGLATVNMTGGTLNVTGTTSTTGLVIPQDPLTDTANFYITGGTLTANSLTMGDYGLLDIGTNGFVRVKGDVRTKIDGYITSGYIVANGGTQPVIVLYDGTYTVLLSSLNDAMTKASSPSPGTGATGISTIGTVLSWNAGVGALSHNVYFGTDSEHLSLVGSEQTATTYDPGYLAYTTTYYWRVDEVQSDGTIKTGDVWNFRTKGSITLEYFENYIDANSLPDSNSLHETWKDGSKDSSSGSSIALSTNCREGVYSCQFTYNNTGAIGGKYYSEMERTVPFTNFLVNGAKSLDIWYKGISGNTPQPIYVSLSDGTNTATVSTAAEASQASSVWIVWHVDLADFTAANASLNLNNISTMVIGVGDKSATSSGGEGIVYFDYFGLWPSRCLTTYTADITGDCKVDIDDFALMASEWLENGMWPLW